MTTSLRTITMMIAAILLAAVMASPASANGFEEATLEDIDENTATCDFDGDGVYVDYWVADNQQTVLVKSKSHVDARGVTHIKTTMIFKDIEYTEAIASPPTFFNDARIVVEVKIDGETLLGVKIRSHGTATDEAGNVLYSGPSNFDFIIEDGVPVGFDSRGPTPPCVPRID